MTGDNQLRTESARDSPIGLDDIDVLLVDDNEAWVDSTATVLEHQRDAFAVTTATTLEAAAETFASLDPDCVVCDYELEHGTGLELLAEVRDVAPNRPFLLVTGAGSEAVASDAIGRQVTDYLPKRTLAGRDDVLARRIETAVHSYRAERAVAQERRSKEAMLDIVTATTSRDGLAGEFCEHLVSERGYDCAWIGTRDDARGLVPQSAAGAAEYLDDVLTPDDGTVRSSEPARVALERRESVVVTPITSTDSTTGGGSSAPDQNRARERAAGSTPPPSWRASARERGFAEAAAVPIEHDETVDGVLAVYASEENTIDEHELEVLGEYGRTIGYAFRTTEWQQSLVSAAPTTVSFEFPAGQHPLHAFAAMLPEETPFEVVTAIVLEAGLCYIISADAASATAMQTAGADSGIGSASVLDEERGRYELVVSGPTPETVLGAHGMQLLETAVEPDRAIVTAVCPAETGLETLVDALREDHPDASVGSIRPTPHARQTTVDELLGSVTDKQRQAIELALYSGYFERPREQNTTEIASRLGISRSTFTQHLRVAQRKVLGQVFDSSA